MMMRYSKRQVSTGLLTLCLGTAVALVAPSVALGAESGTGGTVRATIDSNGAVTTVRQISSNGATSAFAGQLPIKMSITRTVSGTSQTYTYHVENTFSQTQTVHYTDTAGHERHTSVTLQLPLVAQLGVDAPRTMSDINATGALVTAGANGTRHLLWNMVLFSPLGTSAQDVSFTATGRGVPVTELRATAVDPNTAPGLSAKAQDKTAEYQQADFWAGFAGGGNGGLTKLADGTNQMVVGLGTLLSGLQAGVSGADKLASGSADAHDGSVQLRDGLAQIHAGLADTPTALTGGMRLIDNGLKQLADPNAGLPVAVDGLRQIKAGVNAMLAGVGTDTTDGTLLFGTAQISAGLAQAISGVTTKLEPALSCLGVVEAGIVSGASNATLTGNPCYTAVPIAVWGGFSIETTPNDPTTRILPGFAVLDPNFATDPTMQVLVGGLVQATQGYLAGVNANLNNSDPQVGLVAGLNALKDGADLLSAGLSHPVGASGSTDRGGLKQGLLAVRAGLNLLLDPKKGLPFAVGGVNDLAAGSGKEVTGLEKELAGTATALAGSQDLTTGLGQIAAGNQQVADGLPPAVDGVSQLLDGATQVHDGITQVQSGATGPLAAQLTQASVNAHQQIAVLNASTALASQAPGGAGTSYVLAQPGSFALVGASTSTSSGDDHTGRNTALIAIGGVLALAIGLGVGIAMGRSRVAA